MTGVSPNNSFSSLLFKFNLHVFLNFASFEPLVPHILDLHKYTIADVPSLPIHNIQTQANNALACVQTLLPSAKNPPGSPSHCKVKSACRLTMHTLYQV